MKYVIPLGALLLLGVAASFHRVAGDSVRLNSRVEPPVVVPPRPVRTQAWRDASAPSDSARDSQQVNVPSTGKVTRMADDGSWRKMTLQLTQTLLLSPLQQGGVESALRERGEEIRACHNEIRHSKVLDVQQYEWQVTRMKESWFRRIDGLLDGQQHQRFVSLVEQGFFNEGLGITQEPGMTLVD